MGNQDIKNCAPKEKNFLPRGFSPYLGGQAVCGTNFCYHLEDNEKIKEIKSVHLGLIDNVIGTDCNLIDIIIALQ